MRTAHLALALLALAGCGQQPPKDAVPVPKAPSQEPVASSARDRAQIHTELGVSYYEAAKLGYAHGGPDEKPETLFDGVPFDPAKPEEYAKSFKVHSIKG